VLSVLDVVSLLSAKALASVSLPASSFGSWVTRGGSKA
jgi:hypothetical protein